MFYLLVLTAFATQRRHSHGSLRARAVKGHSKVVPRLQADDVFHDDFVHDDTAHPEEAVKINIRESNNKLREAEQQLDALKDQYQKVKDARDEALKVHNAHLAELNTANSMVAKYNNSLASLSIYKDKVKEAQANLTVTKDALNKSDTAATAAAETVKQAQQDLHERILNLVDAKENVSEAKDNVASWQARVQEALRANETLVDWQRKLNASMEKEAKSRARLNQTTAMYTGLHEERKVIEARLDEAQKIFDIDREQYEEYIGPFPPPKAPTENIWWDALTDGKWHEDWPHSFF
jgi:chromosome segregation ATPase